MSFLAHPDYPQEPPEGECAPDIDYMLRGFSNITLPSLPPSNIRRTSSDPVPLGAQKNANGVLAAPNGGDCEGGGFDGAVSTSP
ncbi:hypothetical protein NL676_025382 [Syzygium grande]|nr:hypothetical protein NL676_025382 [Syzygium grande]